MRFVVSGFPFIIKSAVLIRFQNDRVSVVPVYFCCVWSFISRPNTAHRSPCLRSSPYFPTQIINSITLCNVDAIEL
ncbi:hypothetical protein FBUS_08976 [Fasciolopsis buskii]|uniref:Laminin IV type B domain-containing protein n=1 Tax=Fasciolopsis buskii TaxID=27845 RepID=A0A8E0VDN8_9TREM|nr:hypothetical protein FBUS_08976 [Fasciolopsis buski]